MQEEKKNCIIIHGCPSDKEKTMGPEERTYDKHWILGQKEVNNEGNKNRKSKKSLEIFHQALKGKIINLPEHGHYVFGDMGTNEFPELLKVVLQ